MKSRHKILFTVLGGLLLTAGIATESGVNVALSNAFESKNSALNAANVDPVEAGKTTIKELYFGGGALFLRTIGTDYPDVDGGGNYWFSGTEAAVVMDNLTDKLKFYDADNNLLSYDLNPDNPQAVCINMWQRHPFCSIFPRMQNGKAVTDIAKVEISEDLKLPSYAYYNDKTAPSYYTIPCSYLATGSTSTEDHWNLSVSGTTLGTFNLTKLSTLNLDDKGTEMLALYTDNSTDYPGAAEVYNYTFPSFYLNNVADHIILTDYSDQPVALSLVDAMINKWQRPGIQFTIPNLVNVKTITLKAGLLIPSYGLVCPNDSSTAFGYYSLAENCTYTLTSHTQGPSTEDLWTYVPDVQNKQISAIHVRNGDGEDKYNQLYILFIFDSSDYDALAGTYDDSFAEKITVYHAGNKKTVLKDVSRVSREPDVPIVFKQWNEENSIAIPVNGSEDFNAKTIEYISISSECNFPSKSGKHLYNVGNVNLHNEGYNITKVGWATTFTAKNNCHTVTYKNADSSADIGYQMVQKDAQVNLMANPLPDVALKAKVWKLNGEPFSGTMPDNDITLVPGYIDIEVVNTTIKDEDTKRIHIRTTGSGDTFVLFFLTDNDYSGSTVSCTEVGQANFLDSVYFYTTTGVKKLSEVQHTSKQLYFNLWGESGCFAVNINTDAVSGFNTDSVYIAPGCTFPSQVSGSTKMYCIPAVNDWRNNAKVQEATSFTKMENCHTLTYKDDEGEALRIFREPTNGEVTAIQVPGVEEGYYGYWKDANENKIYGGAKFTMPESDYVLTAFTAQIENVDTELLDDGVATSNNHYIQIRNGGSEGETGSDNLFILFLLKDNDYTENNVVYDGDTSFADNITIHAVDDDYTLSDLLRNDPNEHIMFKKWGEANSIGFPIDGATVDATTINSVEVSEGCVFPSMTGEKTYTLAPHEYFNQSFVKAGWSTVFTKAEKAVHNITVTVDDDTYNYRGEEGTTISLPKLPVIEGYHIAWSSEDVTITSDNQFVMPAQDVEVTGATTATTYSITYEGTEGATWETGNHPTEYTIETTDITLSNLTKEGWTFLGWTCEGLSITEPSKNVTIEQGTTGNLVLIAHWERVTHIVTFDADGGTPTPEAQTINYGEKAVKPADPTKEGFTFLGWYNGETKFDFDTPITEAITLKAKWAVTCTVTFDSAGGSEVQSQVVVKGDKVVEPTAPTRNGYTFEGWYNGDTKWDFNNTVNENITLTAHWKKKGGGCGGSIVAGTTIGGIAAVGAAVLLVLKKKKKEE